MSVFVFVCGLWIFTLSAFKTTSKYVFILVKTLIVPMGRQLSSVSQGLSAQ